jgi:hypothetical protein
VLKSQVLMVEILNGRCFSPPFQKIASHFLDTIKWQSFQPFQRKLHVMLMCRFLILKSSPKEKKNHQPQIPMLPATLPKNNPKPSSAQVSVCSICGTAPGHDVTIAQRRRKGTTVGGRKLRHFHQAVLDFGGGSLEGVGLVA